MKEKKIFIDGLEINYKISGEGKPLLILHGWGGSSDSWLSVQEILAKKGYRIICPDLPGFGKSKTPLNVWGVMDYVKWLIEFVNEQKIEKFFVLAHSFGGRIAIKLAVNYPERLISLILCDSAGLKRKLDLKAQIIFYLAKIGNTIFSLKPLSMLKEGARSLFYMFLRNRDYIKAKGIMKETIKKIFEEDLLPDLPKIKLKTLIIWGQKDKMVPVQDAYIFKEKIALSELKILPKIGHSPHLEIPERLTEIILNFLEAKN